MDINSQSIYSSSYLCWKDRPVEINHSIANVFQSLACKEGSRWGLFNGSSEYNIAGIKEHKLMRHLIRKAPKERKDFYALDIGAGDYQWGRSLAQYLNKQTDFPDDIKIHIIGIRGESNSDHPITEIGRCKLYEYGKFQVETLLDEFEKLGLDLVNKIDLIVSKFAFRHFVEPAGTFSQAYTLSRPKTGKILIDGFFFLYENEKMEDSINFDAKMEQLCLETQAPFLRIPYADARSLDHFVICKPDDRPCYLQKKYLGIEDIDSNWQNHSQKVTRFKQIINEAQEATLPKEGHYQGHKNVYEELRQNNLLQKSQITWGPLFEKDINKKMPLFHRAIVERDEELSNQCLEAGCDINESDDTGATPLHLSIKQGNYPLFLMLLKNRANIKLRAQEGSPLSLAVQYDYSGQFVEALIQAGAKIEQGLLDCAIKNKNIKAIELLLSANVIVNYKHRRLLNSEIFSSIQFLLPKKLSEMEGFETLLDYIEQGNKVIFFYPFTRKGYKFQKPTQLNEKSKLIHVLVNPASRLLDDSNYEEIEDICNWECDPVFKNTNKKPHLELQFGYQATR